MIRVLKLKPWSPSSPGSIAHQFLQRCFAGGTPKGKAKLKATGPLKRSKITIKKGGGGTGAPGGRGGGERQRLEQFYDQCMNSPPPIRHLKPKERAREVERSKLGLVSKARKVEMEVMKKDMEKLGVSEKPGIIGTPGLDLITLGVVDAEKIPKYDLTVEDGRRLAKEYSRVLMIAHRKKQAAETALRKMGREAVAALPEHLRKAAMQRDLTPAPKERYIATVTPPIEGYMEMMKDAGMGSGGRQKLR